MKVIEENNYNLDDIHNLKEKFTVGIPREQNHGGISTNIGLVLSKLSGYKPKKLAILIKSYLERLENVKSVSIVGPGLLI